jgi:glycosyltransferase involved in cell wall biosynthesis
VKLVIFTPVNKQSAIARMAALVIRSLVAAQHEVAVVRTEIEPLLRADTNSFAVSISCWNDTSAVTSVLEGADLVVYNIGNSFSFHDGCLTWLQKYPGLVCLHDFYLGHLFSEATHMRRTEAEAILRSWYGAEAVASFFDAGNDTNFVERTWKRFPMTEWVCSMALGVVTHSHWGCERVLNACPGPVRVVPLPYDAPPRLGVRDNERDPYTFRLLGVGHVNPNKRIESVIRAIGSSQALKQRVTYRLVGSISPDIVISLSALANDLGVRLVISGEVDNEALAAAFGESDAVACLRWPCLEAASASTIESMLYGKPVIVTDQGFYSELPDDCVIKIAPDREAQELKAALELLACDHELGQAIGSRAEEWATRTFSADDYASQLVDIATDVAKAAPVINAITTMADWLHRWSGRTDLLQCDYMLHNLDIFHR